MGEIKTSDADFRVLGPVELWVDGEQVDLGPGRQRCVLAVLLLSAGRPVPVDALIDRVWGAAPPEHVRNALYSYVARLRRVLRNQAHTLGGGDPLRRTASGYVLDISPDVVDYHRMRQLVERTRDEDDPARRAKLQQALHQWRGKPLAGLTGEWVDRTRHQLEQYRINAAVEWADIELRIGEYTAVIDHLHDLLAEYPLSEALSEQLLRALHEAGRSAEALDHYGMTRQRIVSELGAEPGPRLRAVHQEILSATSAAPPAPVPRRVDPPRWRGLQRHLTSLIGRDSERAQLAELLERERLVTVTGVGGCGKTALALDVAYDVARRLGISGVALALASATSTEQVVHTLCALVGSIDDGEEPLSAVERILAAQPTLLLLDNCEHLAAEMANLVRRLVGSCPDLAVLATSRQPLSVAGEVVFMLEPLAVPARGRPADSANPAVGLFVERVRQGAPLATISESDIEYAAEICRRLDGLPLALELVAARARAFTLEELVDRLGHNMTLLFRTTAGGDAHHRTLEATLDWSFQMLTDHQRRLLVRMAVFAGGFTVGDAEVVCGLDPLAREEVAAALAALVDRSLVQPYDHDGVRRYRLLEVIRNYAARKLSELNEDMLIGHRHFDHWLDRARRIDALPRYQQRVKSLRALEPDVANLRQCLKFGFGGDLSTGSAEIIALTFEFWFLHNGYLAEGRVWLERALASRGPSEHPAVRALLGFHQALLVKLIDDELRGLHAIRQVVGELSRYRPREYLEASAAMLTAKQHVLDPSVLDEVDPLVATALRSDEDDDVLTVLNAASATLITWGRYARASDLSVEYDRRGVEIGASSWAAQLTVRAEAALGQGDLARAQVLIDQLVTLLGDVAHASEQDSPRRVIALNYLVGGQVEEARRFLDDAWNTLRTADPALARRLIYLRILLAEAQRRCGQPNTALRTLCGGLVAATGRPQFRMSFTGVLEAALIAADLGDSTASRQLATRWDTHRRTLGLPIPIGFTESATGTLDLSPIPPAAPSAPWNPNVLHASVASATAWCTSQQSSSPQPRRTMR